jgi:putative OmpL-like beta-barrel porin-2
MNLVNATELSPGLTPGTPAAPITTETNFSQYLKEGYLSYLAPMGKGLQIDVGKFVTNAGAEVVETKDNWNYSRSLLFSWAIPYFHFGVRAKYTFNSKASLSGFLLNGWNNSVDNNSGKTTGFTLALNPTKKLGFGENYYVGPEQTNNHSNFRHLTDTVVTFTPNSKLSLMANFDYGHEAFSPASPVWWSGFAGYIKYAPNAKWAVATRGEWFKDHNGFTTGTAQNLGEFTLTLERMLAIKIITRLEFRRDMSDQADFPYRTGLLKDAQNTVALAWCTRSAARMPSSAKDDRFYPVAVMLLLCGPTAWAQSKPPLVPAPKPGPLHHRKTQVRRLTTVSKACFGGEDIWPIRPQWR